MDYGYGEIGNRLVHECIAYSPDLRLIRELLGSGIDLNMVSEENKKNDWDKYETMLSEIIMDHADSYENNKGFCRDCEKDICYGCPHRSPDGRYLPEIVRLFLEYGFDCSAQEDMAGVICLKNLTWASYDEYILDAAKLLLKAGANPTRVTGEYPEESVMQWVATKESAADCVDEDHSLSNLFYTLYEIMDVSVKGEDFEGIQYFDHCMGKRIDQIILCSEKDDVQGFFRVETARDTYEHCFRDQMIILCEDMPLCINEYTDGIIDPRIPEKRKFQTDVSDVFSDCIGSRIVGFSFEHSVYVKASSNYHQPITRIHLGNGKTICISTNYGEMKKEEPSAYFRIV